MSHQCKKADIEWDDKPTFGIESQSDTGIEWRGTCRVCKRRVYEVYEQTELLYDLETNQEIF